MGSVVRNLLLALLAISIAGCAATKREGRSRKPGHLILRPHSPYAIAIGPDDNIWFTEYQGDSIGTHDAEG